MKLVLTYTKLERNLTSMLKAKISYEPVGVKPIIKPLRVIKLKGKMRFQFQLMLSGKWFTLEELRNVIGGSDSTISSNNRSFRKPEYGSHTVECELVDITQPRKQVYKYRLIPNQETLEYDFISEKLKIA